MTRGLLVTALADLALLIAAGTVFAAKRMCGGECSGTAMDDRLLGSPHDDRIAAGAGDDRARGG